MVAKRRGKGQLIQLGYKCEFRKDFEVEMFTFLVLQAS
jgi:hypothetical protein